MRVSTAPHPCYTGFSFLFYPFWYVYSDISFFFLIKKIFLIKKKIIGVELIYNVVFISAVQHSESVIHVHISTLF